MKKIEMKIPEGKRAEWVNRVLKPVDEQPISVMNRIKTFQDAANELGADHPYVKEWNAYNTNFRDQGAVDTIAYLQLKIICAALNEDKDFPRFTEDESRYSPYFEIYTKEEIDDMGDEAKKLFLRGGYAYIGSNCGLVFSYSSDAFSYSSLDFGALPVLKSQELSEYCGRQFIDIWKHLLIGKD